MGELDTASVNCPADSAGAAGTDGMDPEGRGSIEWPSIDESVES